MNTAHINLIKERYENAVNEYCIAFCQKHGFNYDPDGWIGKNVGGIVLIGDYYISFDDIRYDIDNDVPEEIFIKYYDYTLKIAMLDEGTGKMKRVNYPHYIMGFRPYSEVQLAKIAEAKKEKEQAEQEFYECLAEQTDKMDFVRKDEVCGNCKSGTIQSDGSCVRCAKRETLQKFLDGACNLYLRGENT